MRWRLLAFLPAFILVLLAVGTGAIEKVPTSYSILPFALICKFCLFAGPHPLRFQSQILFSSLCSGVMGKVLIDNMNSDFRFILFWLLLEFISSFFIKPRTFPQPISVLLLMFAYSFCVDTSLNALPVSLLCIIVTTASYQHTVSAILFLISISYVISLNFTFSSTFFLSTTVLVIVLYSTVSFDSRFNWQPQGPFIDCMLISVAVFLKNLQMRPRNLIAYSVLILFIQYRQINAATRGTMQLKSLTKQLSYIIPQQITAVYSFIILCYFVSTMNENTLFKVDAAKQIVFLLTVTQIQLPNIYFIALIIIYFECFLLIFHPLFNGMILLLYFALFQKIPFSPILAVSPEIQKQIIEMLSPNKPSNEIDFLFLVLPFVIAHVVLFISYLRFNRSFYRKSVAFSVYIIGTIIVTFAAYQKTYDDFFLSGILAVISQICYFIAPPNREEMLSCQKRAQAETNPQLSSSIRWPWKESFIAVADHGIIPNEQFEIYMEQMEHALTENSDAETFQLHANFFHHLERCLSNSNTTQTDALRHIFTWDRIFCPSDDHEHRIRKANEHLAALVDISSIGYHIFGDLLVQKMEKLFPAVDAD